MRDAPRLLSSFVTEITEVAVQPFEDSGFGIRSDKKLSDSEYIDVIVSEQKPM